MRTVVGRPVFVSGFPTYTLAFVQATAFYIDGLAVERALVASALSVYISAIRTLASARFLFLSFLVFLRYARYVGGCYECS